MSNYRTLYPPIEPYHHSFLKVSNLHEIYYENVGNPSGKPVVVFHGGPGGGCEPYYRQFFDPNIYRVVLFDQRGSGRSKPHAELNQNTTWDLVSDIEKLREHLKIDQWILFGGSWGSTLALAYAETHPERVKALILRGIFTLRRKELLFFYQEGTSLLFPDAWEGFIAPIPEAERGDLMSAYHRRLTGTDEAEKLRCAKAWTTWEMATSRLLVDPASLLKGETNEFALAFARIECHYFVNAGWFKKDGQLIEEAYKIAHIPTTIVQGRYDVVCPSFTAWDLHKNIPKSELHIIPDAGHSMKENGILSKLIETCDKYRDI
jgi:proline iminopeptidase